MRRLALLGTLTASLLCPVAAAQDVVIVLAKPVQGPGAYRIALKLPDMIAVNKTEIPKDNLVLIIFDHSKKPGADDPRPAGTVVFGEPGGKSLSTMTGSVGYFDADKKTAHALPFPFPAKNGALVALAPEEVQAVHFQQKPVKASASLPHKPPTGDKNLPPAPCAAFDLLPQVETVTAHKDLTKAPAATDPSPGRSARLDYRFGQSAYFPVPQFGSACGEMMDSTALVIYEGMQVRLQEDGKYEVCFTGTTPDLPVTLRLQLHVWSEDKQRHLFTITLPPIPLEGEITATGNFRGRTFQVRHSGYSHNLYCIWHSQDGPVCRDPAPDPNQPCCHTGGIYVQRAGVARFGTLPGTN